MAVMGKYHYPCIIYMREGGKPIGVVGPDMRSERGVWASMHNSLDDPIYNTNCLDVCVEYNNKFRLYQIESETAPLCHKECQHGRRCPNLTNQGEKE